MKQRLEDGNHALNTWNMGGRVSRFYNTSMFTDDYELLNIEEFIINLLNNLPMENFFWHSERRFIADNDEVVV